MTLAEATIIAEIVDTADNRCPVCVDHLVDQLKEAFPKFCWTRPTDEDELTTDSTTVTIRRSK